MKQQTTVKTGFGYEKQGDWFQVFYCFSDGRRVNLGKYHVSVNNPEYHANRTVESYSRYDKSDLATALRWDDFCTRQERKEIVDDCFPDNN